MQSSRFVGGLYAALDYAGFVADSSNFPNKLALYSNAIGLAGLALEGEYAAASTWIDFAVTHGQRCLSYGGSDGSSFEGPYYSSFAATQLVSFADAIKRNRCTNLFENPFLKEHSRFIIYTSYDGGPVNLEDSDWSQGFKASDGANYMSFMYRLAKEYQDGYSQQFADTNADPAGIFSYLWKDPGVAPTALASLAPIHWFPNAGYVIVRSGWSSGDLVATLKSGSSQGHAHPSQNEFGVYGWGQPISSGPGYASHEDMDATWSHNCLLVDGTGQCQEPGDDASCDLGTRGTIMTMQDHSPYYAYALADASPVYLVPSTSG